MPKVYKYHTPPENSLIYKDFGRIDYCDSFQIVNSKDKTIDSITTEVFRSSNWVDLLMRIRNSLVKLFGLKTENKKDFTESINYPIGAKVGGYFTVIDRNENEIVMGENDKHLNFRVAVMKKKSEQDCSIYVTTIVKFNNIWGRIYFFPVKPFHQIIVKSLLTRLPFYGICRTTYNIKLPTLGKNALWLG